MIYEKRRMIAVIIKAIKIQTNGQYENFTEPIIVLLTFNIMRTGELKQKIE